MHVLNVLPKNYKRDQRRFKTGIIRLSERITRAMEKIGMERKVK